MTITNEQVQDIYEAAVREEVAGNSDDTQQAVFDLLCLLDTTGGTGATIRKLIDMMRAANRVAHLVIAGSAIDRIVVPLSLAGLDEEKHHCEWHLYHDRERIRKELREYFTAPPAPAVRTANCPFCGRRQPDGSN